MMVPIISHGCGLVEVNDMLFGSETPLCPPIGLTVGPSFSATQGEDEVACA
jgi:hypothetical protein